MTNNSAHIPKSISLDQLNEKDHSGEKYQSVENESLIWENFKQGNEEALIYIYRNYADTLFRYGRQFCSDRELLKDALQELFFDLIKNRKKLGKTTSIKFYLFRSFRRKIAKKMNQRDHDFADIDDHADQLVINLNPETIFIADQINENQKKLLDQAINQLNGKQKEAIYLYFFEGFSYEKIAEIFELQNIKSARNMVYRAIDSMTAFIKKSGAHLETFLLIFLINL